MRKGNSFRFFKPFSLNTPQTEMVNVDSSLSLSKRSLHGLLSFCILCCFVCVCVSAARLLHHFWACVSHLDTFAKWIFEDVIKFIPPLHLLQDGHRLRFFFPQTFFLTFFSASQKKNLSLTCSRMRAARWHFNSFAWYCITKQTYGTDPETRVSQPFWATTHKLPY